MKEKIEKKKLRKPRYEREKSKKNYSTMQGGKKLNEQFLSHLVR